MPEQDRIRVAIIGAGPSGIYAAQALLASGVPVSVDVFDLLPAPYGLVRYGVAPDHVKMKSVIRVLCQPFSDADVRFFGNVAVGRDISEQELRAHYHAVIHATGSSRDRKLGIPGEDLPGSVGSGWFVNWYCGHPTAADREPVLDHPGVAVIGAGNVALDVARVLAKSAEEMGTTDIPDRVLDSLRASKVREVHVIIRRAPEHAKFTPAELRQIGSLANADLFVHDDGHVIDEEPAERRVRQNVAMLREWAANQSTGKPRSMHLHFLRSPVRVLGQDRVSGLEIERTEVRDGRVVGTGELGTLEVGLVVRAIGYQADPLPGLPFDQADGIVPNLEGRVVDGTAPVQGEYVTGWVKRGPTGVIGTNKSDAAETVAALLADLPMLAAPAHPDRDDVLTLLADRNAQPLDWAAWLRLDAEELRLGEARGCERVKIADLSDMIKAAT